MALTQRGRDVAAGRVVPRPSTDAEYAFQIALASELVFAWQDSPQPVRDALERTLFNVGVERVDGEFLLITRHGGRYSLGDAT